MVAVVVEGNFGEVVVEGNVTEDAVEGKWLLSRSRATLARSWSRAMSWSRATCTLARFLSPPAPLNRLATARGQARHSLWYEADPATDPHFVFVTQLFSETR